MQLDLSPEQAERAAVLLRAMANSVELAISVDDGEVKRAWSAAYFDNQAKLQRLIPSVASSWRRHDRPYGCIPTETSVLSPGVPVCP